MSCEKTGFHAYCEPHDTFVYGDAFKVGGVWIFRICQESYNTPIRPVLHFKIKNWAHWFEQGGSCMAHNSMMVCAEADVYYHGYDGVDVCR